MLGGMSWLPAYENYLVENNKDSNEVERDENGNILPNEFASKIYPNPATTITNLEIAVPKKDRFEINLYEMNGKFIQSIYKGKMERGTFTYQFDMTEFISGTYFVIINSDDYQESIQFVKF
jgi:myo-inositol-hexaphosphate 3-phosphohydrolase